MVQFFYGYLSAKRGLLGLLALLFAAQTTMRAQNCDPDTIAPVAVCKALVKVAIGTDNLNDCYGPAGPNNTPAAIASDRGAGTIWVKASAFDGGSYDPCGNNLRLTIRRAAPFSNTVLNLNSTNGHTPCNDVFPDFPSEFERAISEQDSIKFYAEEVGTTQTVLLRTYKLTAGGTIAIHPVTGYPIYNECQVLVEVEDKIKPVCVAPADITVTCAQFDPSFAAYGNAVLSDNACLQPAVTAVNYALFDTLCSKGTITRTFKALDCSANSSQCSQKIVVNYEQNYFVRFPNDVEGGNLSPTGAYGQPTFFGEDCELLGLSYSDQVFTVGSNTNLRIERTWTVINWCTYNPTLPMIAIPNPNPSAISGHPANLPGPIVSAPGTASPWKSTISKITPTDPVPTDFSTFWNADANGYTFLQLINVVDTFYVTVQGSVFSDTLVNCSYDAGEPLLAQWTVRATGLISGQVKEVQTDANGQYSMVLDGIDTLVNITLVSAGNFGQNCQTNYHVQTVVGQAVSQHIPVHLEQRCALLSVGIASPVLRRCLPSRYYVDACNLSGETVPGAYVEVELDSYIDFIASSIPGTLLSGNLYKFQLGDLQAGDCNRFYLDVVVNCAAPIGYTHCSEAKIFPVDDCRRNANWSGADVDVTAICDGDSVRLQVANIGVGPMAQILDFVVVEDIIMRQTGGFQLGVGEHIDLSYPADGGTWRLEAEEEPLHPFGGVQAVALEGCGGLNQPGLVNLWPLSDTNPFEGTDCQQNVGSFDPNDKQAFPVGFGVNHFLKSNTDLEYLIRFQNTGTDTAFTVKVLDTLSQHLLPATVRVLASSHPMEFTILGGGVLQFLFNNILLPDSNVNTQASNGFLKFRVSQRLDNQEDTRIENSAAIYFDFNEPVVTNTTFHTINNHALNVGIVNPTLAGNSVQVFPNPTADVAMFKFEKSVKEGSFELTNQMGQVVRQEKINGIQFLFERSGMPAGIYFFAIHAGNDVPFTGKILIK